MELFIFLWFLQTQKADPPLVPNSPEGWLGVLLRNIVPISTAIVLLWRLAIRPINEKLERINNPNDGSLALIRKDLTNDINTVGGKVNDLQRDQDACSQQNQDQQAEINTLKSDVGYMREQFGETKQLVKELKDSFVEQNQKTHNMIGSVALQIAEMRGEVRVGNELKETLVNLLGNRRV